MECLTPQELKDKVLSLPMLPGVYLMKDKTGTIIYVGKAKKLKNRVGNYFQDSANHTPKTRMLVSKIVNFDYIVAGSEFEALVLECSLIKRHQPKYNILLKDDKGYPYIRVDLKEEYPVFTMVGKRGQDHARYFGPYGGRFVTQQALDTIRLTLHLPGCSKKFPRDIGKDRPCLNYQIGNCDGWCQKHMTSEDYRERIRQGILMLEGRDQELARQMKEKMEEASENLDFEAAAAYRDRYRAIEALSRKQLVCSGAMADTDVVGYFTGTAKTGFSVLHFVSGNLIDKDVEVLETQVDEDSAENLSALVKQYYLRRGVAPKDIYLPFEIEDSDLFALLLQQEYGKKVRISVPQRGDNVRLVEMAIRNAREEAERVSTDYERTNKTLELLGTMLGLSTLPKRLEAYDISNLGSTDIVASMTVFVDGQPLKRDYKHFKLKDMEQQDDYGSMRQIIERRFRHFLDGDKGFDQRPDALLIDGGVTHAETVRRQLDFMGLSIPVFGMVKDDRHRTRALVTPEGKEIGIQGNQSVFSLIGRIQEETHRFAITYQRQLRSKHLKKSSLDNIPGVGEKRKQQLLKNFKTIKAIGGASVEELSAVVPRNTAMAVYQYYHRDKNAEEQTICE
ncbi:MAG: excinuclease ABC subunit UvrC [Oscillospiraceae bacterium]|nr:excinuclease ABC subunit UvrC [Oscillospiraceae bacterium]